MSWNKIPKDYIFKPNRIEKIIVIIVSAVCIYHGYGPVFIHCSASLGATVQLENRQKTGSSSLFLAILLRIFRKCRCFWALFTTSKVHLRSVCATRNLGTLPSYSPDGLQTYVPPPRWSPQSSLLPWRCCPHNSPPTSGSSPCKLSCQHLRWGPLRCPAWM